MIISEQDTSIVSGQPVFFPFTFIKKSEDRGSGKAGIITSNLREGKEFEQEPFRDDWIIATIPVN